MAKDDVALMRQVHDEHADVLWRFCLRLVGNDRVHAEDVAQETFLRAWRHRTVLESPPAAVRSWLFTVARNIVIDDWRSRRVRPETLVSDVPEQRRAEDEATDQLLLSWVVAEALTHLFIDQNPSRLGRAAAERAVNRLGQSQATFERRTVFEVNLIRRTSSRPVASSQL